MPNIFDQFDEAPLDGVRVHKAQASPGRNPNLKWGEPGSGWWTKPKDLPAFPPEGKFDREDAQRWWDNQPYGPRVAPETGYRPRLREIDPPEPDARMRLLDRGPYRGTWEDRDGPRLQLPRAAEGLPGEEPLPNWSPLPNDSTSVNPWPAEVQREPQETPRLPPEALVRDAGDMRTQLPGERAVAPRGTTLVGTESPPNNFGWKGYDLRTLNRESLSSRTLDRVLDEQAKTGNFPLAEGNVPWRDFQNVEARAYAQRGSGIFGKLLGMIGLDESGKRAKTSWEDATKASSLTNAADDVYEAAKRLRGYKPGAEDDQYREQAPVDALAVAGTAMAGSLPGPRPPGSLGTFIGRPQAEAMAKAGRPVPLAAINLAERMEAAGVKDMGYIREAVNDLIAKHDPALRGVWKPPEWRGLPGKEADPRWLIELSDDAMRFKQPQHDMDPSIVPTTDLIHHPDLVLADPKLADIPTILVNNPKGAQRHGGYLGPPGNPSEYFEAGIQSPKLREVMGHELGHREGQIAGLSKGTGPRQEFEKLPAEWSHIPQIIKDPAINPLMNEIILRRARDPDFAGSVVEREMQADLERRARFIKMRIAKENYTHNPSEAISRMIEERWNLTPAQGRARDPDLDFDVHPSRQDIIPPQYGSAAQFETRQKPREQPSPPPAEVSEISKGGPDVGLNFGRELRGHAEIGTNFPDADFWIIRKGSEGVVGTPTREFSPEHIGVRVRNHQILPEYLYYALMHAHQQGYYRGRAHGTLNLKNIRVEDVADVPIQGPSFPDILPGRSEMAKPTIRQMELIIRLNDHGADPASILKLVKNAYPDEPMGKATLDKILQSLPADPNALVNRRLDDTIKRMRQTAWEEYKAKRKVEGERSEMATPQPRDALVDQVEAALASLRERPDLYSPEEFRSKIAALENAREALAAPAEAMPPPPTQKTFNIPGIKPPSVSIAEGASRALPDGVFAANPRLGWTELPTAEFFANIRHIAEKRDVKDWGIKKGILNNPTAVTKLIENVLDAPTFAQMKMDPRGRVEAINLVRLGEPFDQIVGIKLGQADRGRLRIATAFNEGREKTIYRLSAAIHQAGDDSIKWPKAPGGANEMLALIDQIPPHRRAPSWFEVRRRLVESQSERSEMAQTLRRGEEAGESDWQMAQWEQMANEATLPELHTAYRSSAAPVRQKPVPKSALQMEADSLEKAVSTFEASLKGTPEVKAKAIEAKFGFPVDPVMLASGKVWWRDEVAQMPRQGFEMFWTPPRIEEAARLWSLKGPTTAQIAEQLSKNFDRPLSPDAVKKLAARNRSLFPERPWEWSQGEKAMLEMSWVRTLSHEDAAGLLTELFGRNMTPGAVKQMRHAVGQRQVLRSSGVPVVNGQDDRLRASQDEVMAGLVRALRTPVSDSAGAR